MPVAEKGYAGRSAKIRHQPSPCPGCAAGYSPCVMKKAAVTEFFERLAAHIEAPTTELDYRNPYTLLVAVVLSAQATDKGVNKATKALFAEVETPAEMVALGEARLKEHIKTIGLYNMKAKKRDRPQQGVSGEPRRRRARRPGGARGAPRSRAARRRT